MRCQPAEGATTAHRPAPRRVPLIMRQWGSGGGAGRWEAQTRRYHADRPVGHRRLRRALRRSDRLGAAPAQHPVARDGADGVREADHQPPAPGHVRLGPGGAPPSGCPRGSSCHRDRSSRSRRRRSWTAPSQPAFLALQAPAGHDGRARPSVAGHAVCPHGPRRGDPRRVVPVRGRVGSRRCATLRAPHAVHRAWRRSGRALTRPGASAGAGAVRPWPGGASCRPACAAHPGRGADGSGARSRGACRAPPARRG